MTSALERLRHGVFGQAYVQVVNVLYPLVSVPALLAAWSLEVFADWAVVAAIPAYLSIADLGMVTVAANEMAAALASGRSGRARSIYRSAAVVIGVAAGCVLLGALVLGGTFLHEVLGVRTLAPGQLRVVTALLAGYVALSLFGQLSYAVLYAAGRYGVGSALLGTARLLDLGALILVPVIGASIVQAAGMLVLARAVSTVGILIFERRSCPWRGVAAEEGLLSTARRILRPALAVTLLPMGNALNTEGVTVALNQVAPPSTVAAWVAVRTLTRAGVSLTRTFEAVARPELALAWGRADTEAVRRLSRTQFSLSVWASLLFAIAAVAVGAPLVGWWTGGDVDAGLGLLVVLSLTAVSTTAWLSQLSPLLATSRHTAVAVSYVGASLGALVAFRLLLPVVGVVPAANALVAADLVMFAIVTRRAAGVTGETLGDSMRALLRPPLTPSRLRVALGVRDG